MARQQRYVFDENTPHFSVHSQFNIIYIIRTNIVEAQC